MTTPTNPVTATADAIAKAMKTSPIDGTALPNKAVEKKVTQRIAARTQAEVDDANLRARVLASTPAPKSDNAGIVVKTSQFFIDPKRILRRKDWNPRFHFAEIESLAASIKALKERDPMTGGLLNDIRVKRLPDDYFELVDGDRRLTAIEFLMKRGETFPRGIPAKLEKADADDLELLIRTFTANTGMALQPLEQANAFKRMQDGGMTLKQIEVATGASDNTIVGCLALLSADTSVQDAVKSGAVKGGLAKSIAVNARGDKKKQAELIAAATAAGKDKKKLAVVKDEVDKARRAKAAKKGLKLKMRALTNEQLSRLGEKMSESLMEHMSKLGLPADGDMTQWVKDSGAEEKVAFTFGVLQGLKAAAGLTVPLVL